MKSQVYNSTILQFQRLKSFNPLFTLCIAVFLMSFSKTIAQNSSEIHYLTTGAYVVNLVIDGKIIDAKHLVIQ